MTHREKWCARYPRLFGELPWPWGFDSPQAGAMVDYFELTPQDVSDLCEVDFPDDPKRVEPDGFPTWMRQQFRIFRVMADGGFEEKVRVLFMAADFIAEHRDNEMSSVVGLYHDLVRQLVKHLPESPEYSEKLAIQIGRFDLCFAPHEERWQAVSAVLHEQDVPYNTAWVEGSDTKRAVYVAQKMLDELDWSTLGRLVGEAFLKVRLRFVRALHERTTLTQPRVEFPALFAWFDTLFQAMKRADKIDSLNVPLVLMTLAGAPLVRDKEIIIEYLKEVFNTDKYLHIDKHLTSAYREHFEGQLDEDLWLNPQWRSNNQSGQRTSFYSMLAVSGITPRLYRAIHAHLSTFYGMARVAEAFSATPVLYATTKYLKRWLPQIALDFDMEQFTHEWWCDNFPRATIITHQRSEFVAFKRTFQRAIMGQLDTSVSASEVGVYVDDSRRFLFEQRIIPDVWTPIYYDGSPYWPH